MRFVSFLAVLLILGLVAGSAMADKYEPNEKQWTINHGPGTAQVPEVEPNDTCPGQAINCGDQVAPASYATTADDDWYQFYAAAGTLVTIATDSWNGSSVDTYLQLYGPDCATVLTYDDDGGPSMFSLISNFVIPTTGYYNIKTYTYSHLYTGEYQLVLTCGVPNPPDPNDTCNPDYVIACGVNALSGDMTWDANNYDPLSGGCSSGYPEAGLDVAYKVDMAAGDNIDIYYSSAFDDAVYIITDCANAAGTCVAGADDNISGESLNYTASSTGTYWVIFDHYGTGMGAGAWSATVTLVCGGGVTGACCDAQGNCTITAPGDCTGQYMGDNVPCDPNPCHVVPVKDATWGAIKAQYR